MERGACPELRIDHLERILAALGARLSVRVLWQGEELDRLLDRAHAEIVDAVLARLGASGWSALPEVTFQLGAERGSIDILAWHAPTATLLVVEVKSVVPDIQATLAGLDRKARLAPRLAIERGWTPRVHGRILVLPDQRTARRRVEAFAATFDRALPARTVAIKAWIKRPTGPIAGVLFLSDLRATQARQRVRGSH